MRVCFVGLGTMGLPMAQTLASGGFEVSGWDTAARCRERFATSAGSLLEAADSAVAIVTMLPEGRHVSAVFDELLAAGLTPPRLFLDCSTIDIETTRRLAERLAQAGHAFVDAPVSGGAEAAGAGTLSFMVGGEAACVVRAQPLLAAMGAEVTAFGTHGAGQAAKARHNMICGITALGVCEAFALADSLGLEAEDFFELCRSAAAQSWILEHRCPVPGPSPASPASNGYAPGFAARLMAKDLRLAQAAAAGTGQTTPFGAAAAQRFSEFAEAGNGELDCSAIYRTIRGN